MAVFRFDLSLVVGVAEEVSSKDVNTVNVSREVGLKVGDDVGTEAGM